MHVNEIKAFARVAAITALCAGKIVHVKRTDGLYIGRMGGWTDNTRLAARYHYDEDKVDQQLLQVQLEYEEEWDVELVAQEKEPRP